MNELEQEIDLLIEKYLPSKNKEKSELGEVFTPISMIDHMYDHFPPSVFKKNHTWLDPSTGIGNFMIVLFFKLMKHIPIINPTKRAKHIIENMLFMVEINPTNVTICKKIFHKLCPTATPNIFKGDFLLRKFPSSWPSSFNCIVGNPPYNIGGTGLEGTKRTHIIFTQHALELTSGYVAYICPPSYREANTTMNALFGRGHFHYIKIYGPADTFNLFHIQGRVDTFIFKIGKSDAKSDAKKETTINDEYNITHNIHLDLSRHIPNFGHTIFDKLYKAVLKFGTCNAFRNTELSTIKSDTFGCNGKNKIMHLIVQEGRRVFKSTKKHALTSHNKILINGLGIPYVFHDKQGKYGPSQSPIIILDPSKSLVQLLQSDLFPFIAWGLRITGNNNLPYIFDYIPNVTSGTFKTLSHIKSAFHLTISEIQFITEHFQAYSYADKDIIQPCKKQSTKKNKK